MRTLMKEEEKRQREHDAALEVLRRWARCPNAIALGRRPSVAKLFQKLVNHPKENSHAKPADSRLLQTCRTVAHA